MQKYLITSLQNEHCNHNQEIFLDKSTTVPQRQSALNQRPHHVERCHDNTRLPK